MKCPECDSDDYVILDILDTSLDGGYPFVDLEARVKCHDCGKEYYCTIMTRIIEGSEKRITLHHKDYCPYLADVKCDKYFTGCSSCTKLYPHLNKESEGNERRTETEAKRTVSQDR